MKNRKDAPLLRDQIKDTLPLIEEEEKKALAPGGFNSGPLDCEAATTAFNP